MSYAEYSMEHNHVVEQYYVIILLNTNSKLWCIVTNVKPLSILENTFFITLHGLYEPLDGYFNDIQHTYMILLHI